jgi:hypothetical protein
VIRPLPSSSERGSAAIEFAISCIVLAILLFGCIGISVAYYTYEVINQYARDASRYAIVHGGNCKAQPSGNSCSIGGGGDTSAPASIALTTYLRNEIFPGINGANLQVTTFYTEGPGEINCSDFLCNGPGDQVTVTVKYPYLYNIPFIPSRLINMYGSSTMVISQ